MILFPHKNMLQLLQHTKTNTREIKSHDKVMIVRIGTKNDDDDDDDDDDDAAAAAAAAADRGAKKAPETGPIKAGTIILLITVGIIPPGPNQMG